MSTRTPAEQFALGKAQEVAEATPHPVLTHPKVIIANATTTRRIARCAHCPWEYSNTIKSDVNDQAIYHRAGHRAGRIAVTR